ncbi:DUF397 domain-containing protein [Streptomyces sp. enrichment culture]|uniref:DUF397 domain-containing protein n=1 Tax=Streptomyces sp. enrichment culture TaxID=1795815 RepID=UPI003F5712AC
MSIQDLHWFKSSYSGTAGDNCVEVAHGPGAVHVRDSKDTTLTPLTLSPAAWTNFLAVTTPRAVPER